MLAGALFACGLQAMAFLVTGSLAAPILAHVVLHIELTMHGDELPPVAVARVGPRNDAPVYARR